MRAWLQPETRTRRVLVALGIYALVTAALLLCASPQVLHEHTQYNHFALQAQGWLEGHLDLVDGPPAYAGNNDFAQHKGHWFVTFPAFPAALLLPLVKPAAHPIPVLACSALTSNPICVSPSFAMSPHWRCGGATPSNVHAFSS